MGGGVSKADLDAAKSEAAQLKEELGQVKQKQAAAEKALREERAKTDALNKAAKAAGEEGAAKERANAEKGLQALREKAATSARETARLEEQVAMLENKLLELEARYAEATLPREAPQAPEPADLPASAADAADAAAAATAAVAAAAAATELRAKLEAMERQLAEERANSERLAGSLFEATSHPAIAQQAAVASPPPALASSLGRVRDYSVLVDASASMRLVERDSFGRTRWELAREAIELIVPRVVERDEDGISLYFFSSGYTKATHVNSVEMVQYHFRQVQPRGGTMLVEALRDAVIPDNRGRPETILVITDGAPENRRGVEGVIKVAAGRAVSHEDLRIVFVQVGSDASAAKWLGEIDGKIGTSGVVTAVSSAQLARSGLPFAQWVARSIMPDMVPSGAGSLSRPATSPGSAAGSTVMNATKRPGTSPAGPKNFVSFADPSEGDEGEANI